MVPEGWEQVSMPEAIYSKEGLLKPQWGHIACCRVDLDGRNWINIVFNCYFNGVFFLIVVLS